MDHKNYLAKHCKVTENIHTHPMGLYEVPRGNFQRDGGRWFQTIIPSMGGVWIFLKHPI